MYNFLLTSDVSFERHGRWSRKFFLCFMKPLLRNTMDYFSVKKQMFLLPWKVVVFMDKFICVKCS